MTKRNEQLRKIILTGLMTALVFLATSVIKIPTTNGYIHLGDGFVFLSAILLGPFYGAFAAGVGSMLADIFASYAQWALPTLLIKSLMALILGLMINQNSKKHTFIAAGGTIVVWLAFFSIIKNALFRAIEYSMDNLAHALEDTPENIMQMATEVQLKLTVAILVFLVLIFFLILWYVKKQSATHFGPRTVLGMMSAGSCMVIGYYISETILYGNPVSPVFSVPMNLIQFVAGIVITVALAPPLLKAYSLIDTK